MRAADLVASLESIWHGGSDSSKSNDGKNGDEAGEHDWQLSRCLES